MIRLDRRTTKPSQPRAEWPDPVFPGERIGVAALSGAIDPEKLERGLDALADLGFEVVRASNLASSWDGGGYRFAGSDDERLSAFHELVEDETLGAIVFARGGHGLLRLLDRIDWDLIARRRRLFVGYSDLTPFLLQVVQRLGWVALHGPMVAADLARGLSEPEIRSLLGALGGRPGPFWPLDPAPDEERGRDGEAEGPLLGGNLSLLNDVWGTEFEPDLEGSVFFWEDIGEPVYRLDRMLRHLGLSGSLAGAHGMVVGRVDWPEGEASGAAGWPAALDGLRSIVGGPIGVGLPAGHRAPNLTLPLGAWVRLDPARSRLEWLAE